MTDREKAISELRQEIIDRTAREDMFWLGEILLIALDGENMSEAKK